MKACFRLALDILVCVCVGFIIICHVPFKVNEGSEIVRPYFWP